MKRRVIAASLLVAAVSAVGLAGGWRTAPRPLGGEARFSRAQMYIEYNATAEDIGMQVSMDGEPWKELRVFRPDGRIILDIRGRRSLATQGFTELFFESSEPPLSQIPLPVFLARFPAGNYEFEGITIDGRDIEGVATFTHAIPDEPVVLQPEDGELQKADYTVVKWLPTPDPDGSRIVAYQITATQVLDVLPKRVFSAHVPASVLEMTIPPEFLQRGAHYELEVLAIEAGGNQTIHYREFDTAP